MENTPEVEATDTPLTSEAFVEALRAQSENYHHKHPFHIHMNTGRLSRAQIHVRFAVDAYVTFARTRPWIEAVAASLTELFAPDLMQERITAFERHYTWVGPAGLTYLKTRLTQAPRDATYALDLVTRYCQTHEQQQQAIAALEFKCDVLWSMLDAIHHTLQGESHNA